MKYFCGSHNQCDGSWMCRVHDTRFTSEQDYRNAQRASDIFIDEDGHVIKHRYIAHDIFTRIMWDAILPHLKSSPQNICFVPNSQIKYLLQDSINLIFSNRSVSRW